LDAKVLTLPDGSRQVKGKVSYTVSQERKPPFGLVIIRLRPATSGTVTTTKFYYDDLAPSGSLDFTIEKPDEHGSGPLCLFIRLCHIPDVNNSDVKEPLSNTLGYMLPVK
ncbi:MAG: hypothetical protein ACYTAF_08375, partial [Planctomycetota bacterium]